MLAQVELRWNYCNFLQHCTLHVCKAEEVCHVRAYYRINYTCHGKLINTLKFWASTQVPVLFTWQRKKVWGERVVRSIFFFTCFAVDSCKNRFAVWRKAHSFNFTTFVLFFAIICWCEFVMSGLCNFHFSWQINFAFEGVWPIIENRHYPERVLTIQHSKQKWVQFDGVHFNTRSIDQIVKKIKLRTDNTFCRM